MKKIILLFSTALVSGFIFGLAKAMHSTIIPNRYFQLRMYRIFALDILKSLNQSISVALVLAVFLVASILALRILCDVVFSEFVQLTIKYSSRLAAILASSAIGFLFFILGGWAVNHYWLPYRFHILSLLADIAILSAALLVAWALSKISWHKIFGLMTRGLRVAAVIAVTLLVIINLGVLLADKKPASRVQNIVLISVDTLRADHLGCYGYGKNTSPCIDLFAQDGILFRNCFAPDDLTLPSHMSLLTSLYPPTHGVNEGISLAPGFGTLAESLRNSGFRTVGFVRQCIWMNPEYGFNQGFEKYVVKDYSPSHPELNAQFQNRMVEGYLRENKNKSNFIFIHYYDVHSDYKKLPYDSPENYEKMFYPDYHGDFAGGFGDLVATKYLIYVNSHRIEITDDDVKYIISLYDGGVAYVDQCIGDLIRSMQELGLYENSLIILTSDHGEEFTEHGYFLHGNNLYYDETMRVPLIIKLPAAERGRREITELVESIDVMPFLLDFLGIEERPKMQGVSFLPLLMNAGSGKNYVFGFGMDKARAFIGDSHWKLIVDHIEREEGYRLFNLIEDPRESRDVKNEYPEVKEDLKAKLRLKFDQIRSTPMNSKGVSLTPEQKEVLKSLGYVSR